MSTITAILEPDIDGALHLPVPDELRGGKVKVVATLEQAEPSRAPFGRKAAAISDLGALAGNCSKDGWDGNGASAIDPAALLNAEAFVRALPDAIPLPEFAPEPDGAISLDWIQSKTRLLSLSVGSSDRLAYAWLDGSDRGHAVAYFDGSSVPPRVLSTIESFVNHGNTSVRVA
ncbi:MAG TPA: hypothetical protein VKX17_02735 [Planctomycetota bacterium]|nr:hypothetical protein [Planctomycetota bacterium]